MEKLNMQTANMADENFKKLAALFPNAITETINENGEVVRAIDKDVLMQEINTQVVEGREERYQFTWPDKRKAIIAANAPTNNTLRPCREESVDFDKTENLYIEGDNLEVLKLLQENYLGKVKMIYIDPPYNTGNDFVYKDDFSVDSNEDSARSSFRDDERNILLLEKRYTNNLESNGRFHTDWLNMIYPRLKVARDLLSDDGVIFISIDDNEVENLKKVCDEIFGGHNHIGKIVRKTKSMTADNSNGFNNQHEYLEIYARNINSLFLHGDAKDFSGYSNPDNDPNGDWCSGDPSAKSGGATTNFTIENPFTKKKDYPPKGRYWAFSKTTLQEYIKSGKIKFKQHYEPNERGFIFKRYKKDVSILFEPLHSLLGVDNIYMNQSATLELRLLMKDDYFNYPKPMVFIKSLVFSIVNNDSIILDFFSGSATTAHAVMQLNAEDGGNRKFIMVQLPEKTDEKSEAYKAGYKNICEIGKERIRRAGKKIKEDSPETTKNLDTGFRVLKLDSSNMQQVYYTPKETVAKNLFEATIDNIKPDRTSEDLLFQVMLELNVPLSAKIEKQSVKGKELFSVESGYILACFDNNLTDEIITEIAKMKPYYFVMRDSSIADDSVAVNFEQLFTTYSPNTITKVL